MARLEKWTAWPAGVVRSLVVLVVLVVVVAVLLAYPAVLRELGDDASRNSALSYADREIAGGNGVVADQSAVFAARALIPEDDAYRVEVSPDFEGGSELTVEFVESYYRYFLMPRRPSDDARWVVCYGCELREDTAHVDVVWDGEAGVSVLRIRR